MKKLPSKKSRVIPGTPKDMGPPYGKRDPYYSHIFRDSYGSGTGIVWEAYHKGDPLLGVPENPIEKRDYKGRVRERYLKLFPSIFGM